MELVPGYSALPEQPAFAWTMRNRVRLLGIGAFLLVSIAGYSRWSAFAVLGDDWALWAALPAALANGTLYSIDAPLPYVWSPVLAPVMGLVAITGFWPQAIAHIAFVLALRDRLLIALILTSSLFWPGVMGGNPLFTLTIVSAILAYRGNRTASLVFLALAVMIPRPVFLPLAVWLLWQRPELRRPFAAIFLAHAAVVAATGYAVPWIETALLHSGSPPFDVGITAYVGLVWMAVGVPLGAWLTSRGYPGLAGVAVSPYILQGYLLMPLVDLPKRRAPRE